MKNGKQPHILNASSNLVGICFIIITGIKLTNKNITTIADEISTFSALTFISSCVLSYLSLRQEKHAEKYETLADLLFLGGMFSLFIAVVIFAHTIL